MVVTSDNPRTEIRSGFLTTWWREFRTSLVVEGDRASAVAAAIAKAGADDLVLIAGKG